MNRKYNDLAVELAKKMRYEYTNITWMLDALDYTLLPDKSKVKHYNNSKLTFIGCKLLFFVISEHFYDIGDNSTIVEQYTEFEQSEFIPLMCDFYELEKYAYNGNGLLVEAIKQEKVTFDKLAVFKAIAGAVYKDKGFIYAKEWVEGKLFK